MDTTVTVGGNPQASRMMIESCDHNITREMKSKAYWGLDGNLFSGTNGIGFYINWNMALAYRENELPLEYPLEEPSWIPEFREAIIEPIIPDQNGVLQPFKRPGLGFEIDKNLLRRYGKRFFRMTEFGLKWKVIREKGIREAPKLKKRKEASQ